MKTTKFLSLVRWAFLLCVGGGALLFALAQASTFDSASSALAVVIVGYSLFALSIPVLVAWFFFSWRSLPESYWVTPSGSRLTPAGVLVLLLVPVYNLYGIFAVTSALTGAYSSHDDRAGTVISTKTLGTLAGVVTVLPLLSCILPAPILWLRYMARIDRARERMLPSDD